MDMQAAIRSVTEHKDLSSEDMAAVMQLIMTGQAIPAQIGGFLIAIERAALAQFQCGDLHRFKL